MNLPHPSVNIFILNYNGKRYLGDCLRALEKVDYPKACYRVILADNGSSDDSVGYVQRSFPWVRICDNGSNLGFGAGNNRAVRAYPDADIYVFLNPDTAVAPDWLPKAVACLAKDERIGLVGCKSVFFYRYARLTFAIRGAESLDLELVRHDGVRIPGEKILTVQAGLEPTVSLTWRIQDGSQLCFPVIEQPSSNMPAAGVLTFAAINRQEATVELEIGDGLGGKVLQKLTLPPGGREHIEIALQPEMLATLIQNAGSYARIDGACGDRGFRQADVGQYSEAGTVDAVCGVSMFIRAALFQELGGFDESYFMYYEDVDLSLRAKALGYTLHYEPASVLRHVHTGTASEWSPFFTCQVVRSHMVFALKFLPLRSCLRVVGSHFLQAAREYVQFLKMPTLQGKPTLRACLDLLLRTNLLKVLWRRRRYVHQARQLLSSPGSP